MLNSLNSLPFHNYNIEHNKYYNNSILPYNNIILKEDYKSTCKLYIRYCDKLVNDFKNRNEISKEEINNILSISYDIIFYDINEFKIEQETKEIIMVKIKNFYNGAIKQINENLDTNFIGVINIFLLQCIILFTKHNIDPSTLFIDDIYKEDNRYIFYKYLFDGDWENYNFIRDSLVNKCNIADDIREDFRNLYVQENFICLIVITKYLKTQTIVEQFLDNIIYCGFSYKLIKTDGFIYTPFEFLLHDIIHAKNYLWACTSRISTNLNKVKDFYYKCKKEHLSKENFNKIILIIFLLLHESFCNFFPNKNNDRDIIDSIKSYFSHKIYRFTDIKDLGMNIPKKFRVGQDNIIKYLFDCNNIYFSQLKKYGYIDYDIHFSVENYIYKNSLIPIKIRKNLIDIILIHLKEMYKLINPIIFKELNSYNIFENWIDIYLMYPSRFGYNEIITSNPNISMNKIKKYIIKYIGNNIKYNNNIFILPLNITNIDFSNIKESYEIELKKLNSSKITIIENGKEKVSKIKLENGKEKVSKIKLENGKESISEEILKLKNEINELKKEINELENKLKKRELKKKEKEQKQNCTCLIMGGK